MTQFFWEVGLDFESELWELEVNYFTDRVRDVTVSWFSCYPTEALLSRNLR